MYLARTTLVIDCRGNPPLTLLATLAHVNEVSPGQVCFVYLVQKIYGRRAMVPSDNFSATLGVNVSSDSHKHLPFKS